MKFTSIILFLIFTSISSLASVLKLSTISNKLLRARSSTPIKVVQDITVTDQLTGVNYSVRETLYVKNGDELKIKVEGKDLLEGVVNSSFIYKGSQRFSFNGSSISTSETPPSFYAPLLYSTSNGGFKKNLLTKNIIPIDTESASTNETASNGATYTKESFTHLSRTNGHVSYGIAKQLSTANNVTPAIWVSILDFQINKIRLNEKGTINLFNYKKYEKRISHASEQVIKWQNYKFNVKTISVTALSRSQVQKELNQNSLRQSNVSSNYKSEALEAFYSAFR